MCRSNRSCKANDVFIVPLYANTAVVDIAKGDGCKRRRNAATPQSLQNDTNPVAHCQRKCVVAFAERQLCVAGAAARRKQAAQERREAEKALRLRLFNEALAAAGVGEEHFEALQRLWPAKSFLGTVHILPCVIRVVNNKNHKLLHAIEVPAPSSCCGIRQACRLPL